MDWPLMVALAFCVSPAVGLMVVAMVAAVRSRRVKL